jgi:hypothetical protein
MDARTRPWLAWVLAVAGCAGNEGAMTTSTAAATTGGSDGGTTIATTTVGSSDSTAPTTAPMHDTAVSTTTNDPATSDGGEESSTGEPPIQFCGLEDLKAGAPNPIVSGAEPMKIPPDIAEILVDNCGCHYADMLDVHPSPDYSSLLPMKIDTWEEWQGTYGPMNKSTLAEVLNRVQDAPIQFTMPHRWCNIGGGEQMDPGQRAVLIEWIVAGGPDGATWVP